ncbi:MAG TPA: GNAT family N-acetyltransferase [Thermoanaerobaculia bacterium]|nr:GNAT family N-acetyltransferase [Thermoanaerobaculia bacterium]
MAFQIRRLTTDDEARACAAMMAGTEPWITLGRDFDESLRMVTDPEREVYFVDDDGAIRGFIILNMHGAFVGYIQTICVAADARSSGIGSKLVAFAEERIFRDSMNVFLCVSSFNSRARALYERLGYELVGELKDYLIRGASELLLRKTRGPILKA